jgi:hypothetical protein
MAEEKEKKAYEPDDGTVDIEVGENEEEQEVEVSVSGVDSEDSVEEVQASEDDDEHQKYTAGVQKRIDRLTKKMREAERQREEAVTYAKSVQTESEKLKSKLQQVDAGYLTEYGGRLTAELSQAQEDYKRAIATGDPDKALDAQQKLTNLQVASSKLEDAKRAQQARAVRHEQEQQAPQAPAQPQQPAAQQTAPQPDPKAEEWADKNEWFGKDRTMTFAAYGIHQELVEDEGFDPKKDEYYDELDKRIKREFPHKFSDNLDTETSRKPAQNVAGVSRTNSSTGRSTKRKLTPSQVAIAKRLGVPLEEYAKYVK